MRIFLHVLLCIIIAELAALFIQRYQPENLTIIYSITNSIIGYIISNYILKSKKVQSKIEEIKEKKQGKSDLDID